MSRIGWHLRSEQSRPSHCTACGGRGQTASRSRLAQGPLAGDKKSGEHRVGASLASQGWEQEVARRRGFRLRQQRSRGRRTSARRAHQQQGARGQHTGTPFAGCPEPPSLSFSRTGAGTAPEHTPQWLIWGRRDLDTRRLGHRDAAPVTPTWFRVGTHQGHAIRGGAKANQPSVTATHPPVGGQTTGITIHTGCSYYTRRVAPDKPRDLPASPVPAVRDGNRVRHPV